MDLRFGCEKIGHGLSSQGVSRYWLTGLCSLYVDDRFGPPPEWKLFDTQFLSALERTPLVAHVNAVPEDKWEQTFAGGDRGWASGLLRDSAGVPHTPEFLETLYEAFDTAAREASAMVFYVEPDPEDLSAFDDQDAKVFINLRMTDAQLVDWMNLGRKFLGAFPPPCAITVDDIYFAIDDFASAKTGHPTWERFIEGYAHASSDTYDLRIGANWDDIEFTR